jgi:hypothetical protein
MSELRGDALNLGQQIRIQNELKHMLGMRAAPEFGVSHLIAERSKCRWAIDAL